MLGKVFARFVEKSPMSVMVRGTMERVLGADQRDAWFARTAQKQYTRTVVFSTSPPMSAHFAALQIKRKLGIPWIADFRDPLPASTKPSGSLVNLVGRFKRYTTTQLAWKRGITGALWQRDFYDHAIRNREDESDSIRILRIYFYPGIGKRLQTGGRGKARDRTDTPQPRVRWPARQPL